MSWTPADVVLVTGAAGLIGRALVEEFLAAGATVVATDVVEGTEPAHPHLLSVQADLSTPEGRDRVLQQATSAGRLAVVVHNAAITTQRGRFVDTTDADLERLWRVNVGAVASLTRDVLRHWRARGEPGVHLVLCSPGGERAHADQGLYDLTKGAVAALVRVVAVEAGPDGVRACGISPAEVSEGESRPVDGLPLRRSVLTREVARTAVWLASDGASAITGVVVPVDGGLLAQLRTPTGPGAPRADDPHADDPQPDDPRRTP